MECYLCHKLIERHEYTRHVGSHLAGNNMGMYNQPDPAFGYETMHHDHYGDVHPEHSTLPRSQVPATPENGHPPHPVPPSDGLWSGSSDLKDNHVQHSIDDHRRANFTSSHSPAQTIMLPDLVTQRETPKELNAFQIWLKNPASDAPKYTTIDGQTKEQDHQQEFIQATKMLRCITREEVVKIVNTFEGFSGNDHKKTCLELVRKAPIFPGLVAYTYTHLVMCPRRGWFHNDDWSRRVTDLKELVEKWEKFGDIWCILSSKWIKFELFHILCATGVQPREHKCNSALLNGEMVLEQDILNLAALVVLCITGPQKNDVLDKCGPKIEQLIELFHNLLETNIEVNEEYRRLFLNPLIQLSKECGYCPRSIYIRDGAIDGLVSESRGGFGVVYKGRFDSRLVAVKALKRDDKTSLPEYSKLVSKEAIIWRHLRHPNCLPLYGVYRTPMEGLDIALVSPWMDQGTLLDYLEHNPEASRTLLILDVARGLHYLHSMQPHVAHRDIKPDNVLITKKGRACLADFGLVSTFDSDDRFHTAPSQIVMAGTYYYMAPEIWNAEDKEARRKVNKRACDMYALGCTIYAAYAGRHPFQELNPVQIRANVILNQRPEFPKGKISPDMRSFVENLWASDPSKRLTAEMTVGWMETKAKEEGMDSTVAPFEEEWQWKGPLDDKCIWSVSLE